MAQNKKKKKVQSAYQTKTSMPGKHANAFLESCYSTARRILCAFGEDVSAFDLFTKRQKQKMFLIAISPPRVVAMKGHRVPRHYIRYVQEMTITSLKLSYFDKEQGVTWMEMLTVGQAMMMAFRVDSFRDSFVGPQRELMERLSAAFEAHKIMIECQHKVARAVKVTLMTLSQPNFRIYGQAPIEHVSHADMPCIRPMVYIVTHESQSLRFKYRNKERTAFRVAMGQDITEPYTGATIAMSKIFPGIKHDRELNIYIQSHALHRFKARIDTLHPVMRNEFFVLSLMISQQVVRGPNGMQYIACIMPGAENKDARIGYFAFTIDGNNLLVLTLLPLLSRNVPEGRILYDRLHLSTEDLKYLGMDRLSFFYEVDIEQIPLLKQVLYDELHLDYIHTLYNSNRSKGDPCNEKRTLFVKNFFKNIEDRMLENDMGQNTDIEETDVSEYE
ncbi:MAG: hypothetical protein LBJ39_05590 [Tannerellaceae bacterium]|jgi:hypothetical protein|nr:hypothetical protein [Tannerellaceae bacterium]